MVATIFVRLSPPAARLIWLALFDTPIPRQPLSDRHRWFPSPSSAFRA
jgi:hypothetical protein